VALKPDGTLWAWGLDTWTWGQLGVGITTTNRNIPTQESTGATNWSAISTGNHTVALKSDGTIWSWGQNAKGQLGDGTQTHRNTPTQVSTGATNWSVISVGKDHSLSLKSDGTLWAWGYNEYGQLGDGTITNRLTPTQESTGATNWSAIAAGYSHTVALKSDGTLWAWGGNYYDQLGNGTGWAKVSEPTQESTGATDWTAIAAGANYTVALKADGTLWAWGDNQYGKLGDGTTTNRTTPTQESTVATNWTSIAAANGHTVALKSDGTLWAWGGNNWYGQLGDGTQTDSHTPTQESTGATDWTAIAAGYYHTMALK